MKNGVGWIALSCIGAMLMLQAPRVRAADMIGRCEVTGQKGQYSFNPMIPGQLTVRANLPSPGWWNGDTPDAVKDGFEYCMAANMAYRLGVDNVAQILDADRCTVAIGDDHVAELRGVEQLIVGVDRKALLVVFQNALRPVDGRADQRGTHILETDATGR